MVAVFLFIVCIVIVAFEQFMFELIDLAVMFADVRGLGIVVG